METLSDALSRWKKELATFLILTFALSSGFYIFFAHTKTLN
ncbi:MAG: hypothetical protein JWO39_2909, partial [Gemmatimonadetes bacterium]|nr:hypothetical protein [Gemmatimonadota bacterium]